MRVLDSVLIGFARLLVQYIRSYSPYLEAIPPSTTWERAMPWWHGPTYHGLVNCKVQKGGMIVWQWMINWKECGRQQSWLERLKKIMTCQAYESYLGWESWLTEDRSATRACSTAYVAISDAEVNPCVLRPVEVGASFDGAEWSASWQAKGCSARRQILSSYITPWISLPCSKAHDTWLRTMTGYGTWHNVYELALKDVHC
jgi:hypothetical protein